MSAQYESPSTGFAPQPRPALASSKRNYGILLAISALVIFIDRITKHIIMNRPPEAPHVVIPGFLRITHVENTGAAFSMFAESATPAAVRHGLILFSIVAVVIVFAMLWRVAHSITLTSVALALILGGAIGNLYDRLRYHYVVDFIEVHIIHYHWPDFNLADSAIVIGACLLMIEIFRPQSQA